MSQNILVTGGTGYIGSHTIIELLNAGYNVICVDNLSNSKIEVLDRIAQLSPSEKLKFYQLDIQDRAALSQVFSENNIDAVIHFAAFKAVGESVLHPLKYYHNNIIGSLVLLEVMQKYQVKKIVFSSSAAVYGEPAATPIREDFPTFATNPYGFSKLVFEQVLDDLRKADDTWCILKLRYFNPVGAHSSGLIGEDPNGIPNNLMPYISQVAVGKCKYLNIFGNDYPTPDGTAIRDYIHVVDLAIGHLLALDYLNKHAKSLLTLNLGTGMGHSVLEVIHAFEEACGKKIPYKFVSKRSGDVAKCYADPTLANQLLSWKTQFSLLQMCCDSWNWQSKNPNGYA